MEKSFIFDAVFDKGNIPDRKYFSSDFARYFASFIGNGVYPNPSTNLQVIANEDMTVTVKAGKAFINGRFYENTGDLQIKIDVADGVLDRIDSVVVQCRGLIDDGRKIVTKIKKGKFSSNSTAPELQRDTDIFEIQLAQISIKHGAIKITQADITDTRLDKNVCGIVQGLINQVDTTTLFLQYKSWYEQTTGKAIKDMAEFQNQFKSDLMVWYEGIKDILGENVAINLQNQISDLNLTKADLTYVDNKTGINAKATYANNTVTITAPISAQQITFIAPSDFSESDTYTLNGTQITITDLNNEPLSNAWKQGSPVQLILKGNQGFFKSGGGDSKLNIFAQPTQPPINEGIWLQTNDKFKNVQVANNVVNAGDWSEGNFYKDMPTPRHSFGCAIYSNLIYCISGNSKNVNEVYHVKTNSWETKTPMPVSSLVSFGCVPVGDKIYCIGGWGKIAESEITDIQSSLFVYDVNLDSWERKSNMPIPRYAFGCVPVGEKIYCIGGNSTGFVNTVSIYDTKTDTWSVGVNAPTKRGYLTASFVNNKVYCIGGVDSDPTNVVEMFDVDSNIWSSGAPMLSKRRGLESVSQGDKIYCIGGDGTIKDKLEVYDTTLNSWSEERNIPTPRGVFGCALFDGKIYCIGGQYNYSIMNFVSSIETYDIVSETWSLSTDLRQSKYGHHSVEYEGKIYTIGGSVSFGAYLSMVEIYDIKTNTWVAGKPMPTARDDFGCVVYDGKIFCIGGEDKNNGALDVVEIYDIKTDTWAIGKPMTWYRTNFGCAVHDGKIYCIGGFAPSIVYNTLQIYDIKANAWATGKPIPTARRYFGCVAVGDKIYCIAGNDIGVKLDSVEIYDIKTNTWTTGKPTPTKKVAFGCVAVGTKIYCVGGSDGDFLNTVEIYDINANAWATGKPMLITIAHFGCIYYEFKIYSLGGNHINKAISQTQIMTLYPTKFPENTLVLKNSFDGVNKYYTQLVNSKQLFGDRLLSGFENAWIYANEKLKEYPAYYGDGEKWNKFKN